MSTLTRDTYGAIHSLAATVDADRLVYMAALALVGLAAKSGKIPSAFDGMEWERCKRIGSARHHEIYDISPDSRHVLVCVREVNGTRYGQSTTGKTYYLISKYRSGVRVSEASKALAAKAAKAAGPTLGLAIMVVTGKKSLPTITRIGYKIVRRCGQGFMSVWDSSSWEIGVARVEAATPNHDGGYYFYDTLEQAIKQAEERETFGDCRPYAGLSILEVEVSGREYGGIKKCATRIKPIREICAFLAS